MKRATTPYFALPLLGMTLFVAILLLRPALSPYALAQPDKKAKGTGAQPAAPAPSDASGEPGTGGSNGQPETNPSH